MDLYIQIWTDESEKASATWLGTQAFSYFINNIAFS